MQSIFDRKWFIATVASWIVILVLDELVYYWWKSLNPGSQYSGVIVKHPLQDPGSATS